MIYFSSIPQVSIVYVLLHVNSKEGSLRTLKNVLHFFVLIKENAVYPHLGLGTQEQQ